MNNIATAEMTLCEEIHAACEAKEPVEIIGGGTREALGRPVEASRKISLSPLTGVSLYEPGALTIVAWAGTTLSEIEAMLAKEGQRLAFEPMDHRALLGSSGEPTIGAVAAMNNSGPRRIQAGAARDSMLGLRLIDGRGKLVRNGGRVMKNVTGYDLVKLVTGSWGTLGVITEVSLKVLPAPECEATLIIEGLEPEAAIAALSAGLGSPYDVTGAAWYRGKALLRLEGFEAQIAHRAPALSALLKPHGPALIAETGESRALWRDVRDVKPFHGREGAVWRVSLRPSDAPGVISALKNQGEFEIHADWGGGLLWLLTPEAGDAGAALIRAETKRAGGHSTLVRAGAATRESVVVFEPEAPGLAAISERVRAGFDPHLILNRGRMRKG